MPNIHIVYCGGWGYGPRFKVAKAALEANVPNCTVTGEPTPGTSGAFEVKDMDTGKLYHSKLGGDGHLDTKEGLQKVIDAIKADHA